MIVKKIAVIGIASSIFLSGTSAFAAEENNQNKLTSWFGSHLKSSLPLLGQLEQTVEQNAEQRLGLAVQVGEKFILDPIRGEEIKSILLDKRTQSLVITALRFGINPKIVIIEELFKIINGSSDQDPLLEVIQLGINTSSGISIEQLKGSLEQSDHLPQMADKVGIDTTDKNVTQLSEAVLQKVLTNMAYELQIDPGQLTIEQLKEAIQEKQKSILSEKANQLGIDISGKTQAELEQAVKTKQIYDYAMTVGIDPTNLDIYHLGEAIRGKVLSKLQDEANQLGIDHTSMTLQEIRQTIALKKQQMEQQTTQE